MKQLRTLFSIFCLLSLSYSYGQNGVDIESVSSPIPGFNYDSNAIVDVKVIVQNDGPNFILNGDTLYIKLNIANPDTTLFFNYELPTDGFFNVDDAKEYTLISNFNFTQEQEYTICASIDGTKAYPTNLTKNASACSAFIIGIEELEAIKVKALRYQEGLLLFESNKTGRTVDLQVLDITGRLLTSQRTSLSSTNQIAFSAPAKGFYFLRLIENGNQGTTVKFVVH